MTEDQFEPKDIDDQRWQYATRKMCMYQPCRKCGIPTRWHDWEGKEEVYMCYDCRMRRRV